MWHLLLFKLPYSISLKSVGECSLPLVCSCTVRRIVITNPKLYMMYAGLGLLIATSVAEYFTSLRSVALRRPSRVAQIREQGSVQARIQKFPDWVDTAVYANNNKHSLRSNAKGYGGRTHWTDSRNSDTTARNGRELYHLQFSLQAASPETFGYTLVYRIFSEGDSLGRDLLKSRDSSVCIALGYGLDDRGCRVRFPAGAGDFSLHHRVQNGSGAHPASYSMGTGDSFPGGKAAGAWSWALTSI
jgi:hypothetical protein